MLLNISKSTLKRNKPSIWTENDNTQNESLDQIAFNHDINLSSSSSLFWEHYYIIKKENTENERSLIRRKLRKSFDKP